MANIPSLSISPRSIFVVGSTPSEGRAPAGLRAEFKRGLGFGLLQLGGPLLHAALEPSLAFGRELARGFYEQLCRHEQVRAGQPSFPELPRALVTRLLLSVPPISGAEYLCVGTLEHGWAALADAAQLELGLEGELGLDVWLERKNPAWHALGRVYFHLAENKRDPDYPFAFVATYVDGLADSGEPIHRTLGHALQAFASDRDELLRLLRPLELAGRNSPLIAQMIESGLAYRPSRWTPAEAFAFLQQIPACEAAGVRVRVPDWWRGGARKVQAQARVGQRESSQLGVNALLDFDVALVLGDDRLSPAEARELLGGAAGLRLVRGQWVAVDPDRLRQALDHFREISAIAGDGELSFAKGMRMLAGVGSVPGSATHDDEHTTQAWGQVVAGEWLARVLEELGEPEARREASPGNQLKASLRPYQVRGVTWMWLLWQLGLGGCLADDMGLGKTIQVLALMLVGKRRRYAVPHLVVVPASLLGNWEAEAHKFAPSLSLLIAHRSRAGALARPSWWPSSRPKRTGWMSCSRLTARSHARRGCVSTAGVWPCSTKRRRSRTRVPSRPRPSSSCVRARAWP